jgi:hypothetical protein
MIAIYSNNHITDEYVSRLSWPQQYQVYHCLDHYLGASACTKIAFVNHINSHYPPRTEQARLEYVMDGHGFAQEIAQVKSVSRWVFAFDNEIHPYHMDRLFAPHSDHNVCWAIPGFVNDHDVLAPGQTILWNAHVSVFVEYQRLLLHQLQLLQHNQVKPRFFDALLGQPRLHRDFVYESITQQGLQQEIFTTYLDGGPGQFRQQFCCEPGVQTVTANLTSDHVHYQGLTLPLSWIVPIEIYNQTAYSIVAETGLHNGYSFFTEKIAKAMAARRLFVVFSGAGFLANLKRLGFQTFDHVIDESYDHVTDHHERWQAAFEQVKLLCDLDQLTVLHKIQPRVEHNYQLLMNTDWIQLTLNQVQEKIDQQSNLTQ